MYERNGIAEDAIPRSVHLSTTIAGESASASMETTSSLMERLAASIEDFYQLIDLRLAFTL
jgi:hypothetical protein